MEGPQGLTPLASRSCPSATAPTKRCVDRWERGDRGITAALLWRYLQAIGATFADLGRELAKRPPPL